MFPDGQTRRTTEHGWIHVKHGQFLDGGEKIFTPTMTINYGVLNKVKQITKPI
jgi:hypothetical protein